MEAGRPVLLRQRVERDMSDGFVHFGGRTAYADASDSLTVDLDGQPALVGKSVRERQHLQIAVLQLVGRSFGRLLVKRRMPRLLLGELNGVQSRAVALL